MTTIQVPECPNCRVTLAQKDGKFGIYYACPNWRSDGSGCEGFKWFPPKGTTKGRNGIPRTPKLGNGQQMASVETVFELQAIRAILERIESVLVEKAMQNKYGSQDSIRKANEELQIMAEKRKAKNTVDGEPVEDTPISQIPF